MAGVMTGIAAVFFHSHERDLGTGRKTMMWASVVSVLPGGPGASARGKGKKRAGRSCLRGWLRVGCLRGGQLGWPN